MQTKKLLSVSVKIMDIRKISICGYISTHLWVPVNSSHGQLVTA